MNDYVLIFQYVDRCGNGVYYRYSLSDAKQQNNKLGEFRIAPDADEPDINAEIARDWTSPYIKDSNPPGYKIKGGGTG